MKKFLKKLAKVLAVLVFEIVYIVGLGVYLIYYTDMFTTTRDIIVTTSMTTMTHQYFATWFLSTDKINEILANTRKLNETGEQKLEDVKVDENKIGNDKDKEGITVENVSTNEFNAWIMIIDDPSRVKLVTCPNVGVSGATTSQIVEYYGAIAGINAGGMTYDAESNGGIPSGITIVDNEYYGYVNPYEYMGLCGFTQDNKLYVTDYINKAGVDALNLRCAVSFSPAIIVNGIPRISGTGGWGFQPRTCIGQRQDGAVLFLVIDGRQLDSGGADLKHAQDILLNYGAYNAFNLDGGASTTMVFDGKLVNQPSDFAGERYVPTAFIVE